MIFKTGDKHYQKDLYFCTFSGVAVPNMKGNSGAKWRRDTMEISIKIPTNKIKLPSPRPANKKAYFQAKHWTVYANLNATYNQNASNNSGHAVDAFRLVYNRNIRDTIYVRCDLATRDVDAWLFRVGFKVELLLHFQKYA